jgi:predicted GNAT superfamily acetyltransferase
MEPVTDLTDPAVSAARAAGVTVRELRDLSELNDVVELFASIWGRDDGPPMNLELLRALTKAGNYAAGAFADDRLVGACVGFFHAPSEDALHSHIAGVADGMTGRNVGFALKLHQRSWAMARGVSQIAWTFDPLISRNAYFNLVKLGAQAVEYLPNFYGSMLDTINGGDDSDRLLVKWPLRDPAVVAACSGRHGPAAQVTDELTAGATIGLDIDADGSPLPGELGGETVLVAVPRDIEALRAADSKQAKRWRLAVRETLSALLEDGGRIDGFDKAGWYVIRRNR